MGRALYFRCEWIAAIHIMIGSYSSTMLSVKNVRVKVGTFISNNNASQDLSLYDGVVGHTS